MDPDDLDIEPSEPARKAGGDPPTKKSNSRRSFTNLRRELTDEELKSPAVQKFLIDEIDRLERELENAAEISDKYHAADKKAEVLQEKLNTSRSKEIVHLACITTGGVALGTVPGGNPWPVTITFAAIGVILVGAGIWAKVIKL